MNEDSEQFDALPTEEACAGSRDLDLLDTKGMLEVINAEDQKVALAVRKVISDVALAVDATAKKLLDGGHWHAFGAGTSGRIALLDAVECPPTFGVSHALFQGHMAGGMKAFTRAVEGAEDTLELGIEAVAQANVRENDVVCAISASGRTPFCLGVLQEAKRRGVLTIAIASNAKGPIIEAADLGIAPATGPEVLTGSTRLKAGTAQKMILNMISTGVMVKMGHTFGHLMVGVVPSNVKLRARAHRLIEKLSGTSQGVSEALESAGGDVRCAVLILRGKMLAPAALALMKRHQGSLRRAMEEIQE